MKERKKNRKKEGMTGGRMKERKEFVTSNHKVQVCSIKPWFLKSL